MHKWGPVGEPPASKIMVTDCLPARCLAYKDMIREVNVSKVKVSLKLEMACPFNRGYTMINRHVTF